MKIYLQNSNKQVLQLMQAQGFNVMTCPECPSVKLSHGEHDTLECDYCGVIGDTSDFPDLEVVEVENQ